MSQMNRRLFWDIETSPNIVLSWRTGYKINISHENILQERAIICIAWKWEGEDETHSLHWDKNHDDSKMIAKFLKVAEEADEMVAYFGDSFDMPWLKTRCLFHGFVFPDFKTIDPLQWIRRKFYFNSNKMDYVSQFLKLGEKLETQFDLWKGVMADDPESLKFMVEYNEQDVRLLEKIYAKLSLVMKPKTHRGVSYHGAKWTCPRCGSTNVKTNKKKISATGTITWGMQCKDDGGYFTISNTAHEKYQEGKR